MNNRSVLLIIADETVIGNELSHAITAFNNDFCILNKNVLNSIALAKQNTCGCFFVSMLSLKKTTLT